MALPSGFSLAALALREALAAELSRPAPGSSSVSLNAQDVRIGAPAALSLGTTSLLNLFFYRAETGAFPSDAGPSDPFYVRLFCLVTAFGVAPSSTRSSAGEIELQLIGNVMAFFHRNPTLVVMAPGQNPAPLARLQVVFTPLTLEAMNNLWSTQKETAYRLSVAYELALVPAQPTPPEPSTGPLVIAVDVNASPVGSEPSVPRLELALLVGGVRQQSLRIAPSGQTTLRLTAYSDEAATLTLQSTWLPARPNVPPPRGLTPIAIPVQGPLVHSWSSPQEITLTPQGNGQLILWATATTAHGPLPTNRVVVVIAEPSLGGGR